MKTLRTEALLCLAKRHCRAAHQLLAWRSFPAHQGEWA